MFYIYVCYIVAFKNTETSSSETTVRIAVIFQKTAFVCYNRRIVVVYHKTLVSLGNNTSLSQ